MKYLMSIGRRCNVDAVKRYVALQERPILIGRVAVEFRLSLAEAEDALEDLVEAGVVRRLTDAELKEFDITYGFRRCTAKV